MVHKALQHSGGSSIVPTSLHTHTQTRVHTYKCTHTHTQRRAHRHTHMHRCTRIRTDAHKHCLLVRPISLFPCPLPPKDTFIREGYSGQQLSAGSKEASPPPCWTCSHGLLRMLPKIPFQCFPPEFLLSGRSLPLFLYYIIGYF